MKLLVTIHNKFLELVPPFEVEVSEKLSLDEKLDIERAIGDPNTIVELDIFES